MSPSFVALSSVVATTLQLIRFSVDLVRVASTTPSQKVGDKRSKDNTNAETDFVKTSNGKDIDSNNENVNKKATENETSLLQSKGFTKTTTEAPLYGSVGQKSEPMADEETPFNETQPLLSSSSSSLSSLFLSPIHRFRLFLIGWTVLLLLFVTTCLVASEVIFPTSILIATAFVLLMEVICLFLDKERVRYGPFARIVRLTALMILWLTYTIRYLTVMRSHKYNNYDDPKANDDLGAGRDTQPLEILKISLSKLNIIFLVIMTVAVLLALVDGWITTHHPTAARRRSLTEAAGKPTLSREAVMTLIQPYFWPSIATGDATAMWNRVRAVATWICVICSKACNLVTPLLLGKASTALAHGDYTSTIRYSIAYGFLKWLGNTFKEAQSLVYLKVAQTAFVQLSEASFQHLHHLSLDWHLRKKLGEVLRSMDRGILACDTLMKYLFLWLVPAITECLLVTIIFATYFQYFPLAVSVFYFVFVYIVWTILVTLWRKKFRKALVKHDNEWHDLFTDSMVNFETVKYFTAEDFERKRFREAVGRYQTGSVHVQGSLSFLNVSQQLILQGCLATALSLAAWGIEKRSSCCVESAGCEMAISDCCRNVSNDICPGMEVGDFVAVLTYVTTLFFPLNFLGSVYNSIVMAMIDLTNLSELLAESPDVTDFPDAFELPKTNSIDPDVAIEFDNVYFHYPTQPEARGLKGLSFKMKRGTTTAIVGPTGAGKTTVSRLLFRFYDALGGAVKINGVDVRSVTQSSLRGAIGVVPQAASMFNDTIRFNLLYGRPDATEDQLIQAAKDAQILGFIESLDEGWETLVGDRGLKLSGGEKQRAAIARCLLKDPPFVLLDEATSALDTITENSVQEALDRLGKERTVLVIAHRLGTIKKADNIVVLRDGQVAEQGTHDELLALNGMYADMWNMQLHSNQDVTGANGSIETSHATSVMDALAQFDKSDNVALMPDKSLAQRYSVSKPS